MSEQEKRTKSFVVDTNLFVAAIKPFSKSSRSYHARESNALNLLIKLIINEEFELMGNSILVDEYRRFAQELDSQTSKLILKQLVDKTKVVDVTVDSLELCKRYLSPAESADVVHAATCLQTGAILITNDRDFDKIKASGIVRIMSITEAIQNLL